MTYANQLRAAADLADLEGVATVVEHHDHNFPNEAVEIRVNPRRYAVAPDTLTGHVMLSQDQARALARVLLRATEQ
ncbi:hypothetical protein ACIGKQ_03935 [Gordonia sp. NPDC062954]|uniref:hypothetical protein n=1 Tax=Gordonia sp. NPDC062954 TaxID=3364003 RepID=UPI0037C936FE